jgi:hypothetical protein
MVRRVRGVHALSLIEIKKKLLMAQKGGADISELFNTSLWTGTGAARTITTGIDSGEGSLVWSKSRSAANGHILVDTVRGAGNYLSTNSTGASVLNAQSVSSFTSTGYDLGTFSDVNGSGTTQVGWQFRRDEKFFDIVQYTGNGVSGRTISHNIGGAPGILIVKRTDSVSSWLVQHISTGAQYAGLQTTGSFAAADASVWPNVFTASDFFVGTSVNASGGTYIAYLFAHDPSPDGIIQCGSYVGNGSATGPVVNLGWRPQYLMIKNASATGDWQIFDTLRGIPSPGTDNILAANRVDAEIGLSIIDLLVSGFQPTSTYPGVNSNGQTYIYMAIREAI